MNNPDITLSDIRAELKEVKNLLSSDDKVDFPVKIFPSPVQEIINASYESLGFPIDFIGSAILYAASVGMGGVFRAQVKNGWTEPGILYIAIAGKAGQNKSHPLTWALAPIQKKDAQSYRLYQERIKYYEEALNMTKSEREEHGIGEPQKPHWIKYLLTDFTPEALVDVHRHNLRGIGIYVDELASWFKSFGRYTKGAEAEFWLSSWSSKSITVDRKGSEPTFIAEPFISVIGTLQPSVLKELGSDNRSSNGFIDRIIFCFDEKIKTPYWSDKDLSDDIPMTWTSIMENLFSYKHEIDEEGKLRSKFLNFSPAAKSKLYEWQRHHADEANGLQNEGLSGLYSKLSVYCIRFALILEVMENAVSGEQPKQINLKAVEASIDLVRYFKEKSIQIRAMMDQSITPLDSLPTDKRQFVEALPIKFKTSEALSIAKAKGIPERTAKRLLNKKELFTRAKKGEYEKKKLDGTYGTTGT